MLEKIYVKNRMKLRIIAIFLTTIVLSAANAQEDDPPLTSSKKPSKTVYLEFGDQLVEGAGEKPSAEYIFTRSQFNFKRLIKLKNNFQQEVRQGKGDFVGNK